MSGTSLKMSRMPGMPGPAYDFAAIFTKRINFVRGAYLTAVLCVLMMPWKLIESSGCDIFTWLGDYGALLGPVLATMIADDWLVRRTRIDVPALYRLNDRYGNRGGWNPAALIAFAVALALAPNVPCFLASAFPQTFGGVPAVFKESTASPGSSAWRWPRNFAQRQLHRCDNTVEYLERGERE